jgi:hypothetical protein
MNVSKTDVHRTLTYSDSKVFKQFLIIALALLATGLLGIFSFSQYHEMYWPAWGMVIGGAAFTLFCHFRIFNGSPLLTLSPKGLVLATVGKKVFIPWHEVRGIETVSFKSWTATWGLTPPVPVRVGFDNVTAVLISRDFYEDEVVSAYPTLVHHRVWSRTFRSQGNNLIQVCLHHDILPAKSEEIRREVAARWYAFRDADKAPNATGSGIVAADMTTTGTVASPRPAGNRKKIKFLVRWGKKP